MDSPNMIANIRTGMVGLIVPFGVKPSSPDRCPSWKIHTTTPYIADSDRMFITIASTGSTSDPNARNSSTNVAMTTASPIHGRVPHGQLGHRADGDRMPDLAGNQIEKRPGRDGLRAGQVPYLAGGASVGAEGGQASGDVRHVAVGVGQFRVADEVGAPAGQGVGEDPLAEG